MYNHWKIRPDNSNGLLKSVYDGAIWKEFLPTLLTSFALGLMLNIDWFQPYTHTMCSVGVIYFSIMNLPRHIRSKRENIILVGIIPGPEEPKHDIFATCCPRLVVILEGRNHGCFAAEW